MKLDLGLPKRFGWFLLCWIAIFLSIEYSLYGLVGSLSEDIPRLYGQYALRSLFFASSSALCVAMFHANTVGRKRRREPSFFNLSSEQIAQQKSNNSRLDSPQIAELRVARPQIAKPQTAKLQIANTHNAVLLGALLTNFSILVLLFYNPSLFSTLALEGVFVEPLSAIFFFAGSAILCWLLGRINRQPLPNKFLVMAGLSCLALIFFVIAMEEVSWFQRAVGFETPDAFASNLQGEFNIHNFATKMFENVFYVGAFVCLIILPFLSLTSTFTDKIEGLNVFIGSRSTLCVCALTTAYNYHYWNGFPTQLPFFLTLFILISLGLLSREERGGWSYATFAITLVITQIVFIYQGHTMPRLWDATEYKEFFIAASFFLYSLDIKRNLLQNTAAPVTV